ncbi:MAG: protein kinase, partial [Acetobacteraceae bacterium]|nr:protein kinase [Acetobacteraceae bacterium]
MSAQAKHFYAFGPFRLDSDKRVLVRDGIPIPLAPKAAETLLLLVENAGHLVEKGELMARVWPDAFVEEANLPKNILTLRKVLGEWDGGREYIATVPKRGYRFVAPVEEVTHAEAAPRSIGRSTPNLIGQKVSHYRVLEVIGGGGMGMVYRAEDLKLGREVALKFLPPELANDRAALQRFEREARAALSLDHANICTIHGVEEHDGQPFIVMQLLQGETLRNRLNTLAAEQKKLPLQELLETAIQICDALQAAHAKGIVHRDIKPANIFLTEKNVAKILDFGVAKVLQLEAPESHSTKGRLSGAPENSPDAVILSDDRREESKDPYGKEDPGIGVPRLGSPKTRASSLGMTDEIDNNDSARERAPLRTPKETALTRTGMKLGTAGYMSPEQVRGEPLDARTDIFSFGLVLYEMATGQRAFAGETLTDINDAIVNRPHLPVREANPEIPSTLERVINKCLEKEREQRYQTIHELKSALRRVETKRQAAAGRRRQAYWIAASLVILGSALAVRLTLHHQPQVPAIKEQQLTANPLGDGVMGAAISPDGKYVAYKDPNGVYIRTIESGETRSLNLPSSLADGARNLCWSPVGGKLLIDAAGPEGWNIWIVDGSTATEARVLYRYAIEPAVSKDGMVAFTRREPGKPEQGVWVGGIDGRPEQRIAESGMVAAWSPDGRWIAYARGWKNQQGWWSSVLEIRPAKGGPAKTLLEESSLPNSSTFMAGNDF